MRPLILLMVTLAALSAGCTDSPDDGADDEQEDTTPSVNNTTGPPKVFEGTGTVTASTTAGGFGAGGLDFTVDEGATVLFAELQWDDPVADIDLSLASPSSGSAAGETTYDHQASGGSPGSPDSPHSLTIETPEAGAWQGGALANGAAANVEYTIVVSVFYGEPSVPEGYTALS